MLRKLMKYEMVSMGRILLPIYGLVLALGLSLNVGTKLLLGVNNDFLDILTALLGVGYVMACGAALLLSFVLMAQRFYSNLLTDQGYVMMTLPTSIHQQIFAKLLTACLWIALTGLVVAASVLISSWQVDYFQIFRDIWQNIGVTLVAGLGLDSALVVAGYILVGILSAVAGCLQVYAALAMGHSFAGSKMVWSVVIYLAWGVVNQIIGSAFLTFADPDVMAWMMELETQVAVQVTLGISILNSLLSCIVGYGLTAYFMTRKLNLA